MGYMAILKIVCAQYSMREMEEMFRIKPNPLLKFKIILLALITLIKVLLMSLDRYIRHLNTLIKIIFLALWLLLRLLKK